MDEKNLFTTLIICLAAFACCLTIGCVYYSTHTVDLYHHDVYGLDRADLKPPSTP